VEDADIVTIEDTRMLVGRGPSASGTTSSMPTFSIWQTLVIFHSKF